MLTAKTKTGKKLCLGYKYKKETLLYLRSKEEFFCPVCEEKVSLKIGDKKIYHFAHQKGGSCREFYENETEYHMKGKLQLYQWLKGQNIAAELEYFDKEIQQRPDILFLYNGNKFAVEFQCSSIPEQLFTKRTENYLKHGYTPLWILGGNHYKKKDNETVSITNFQYLFLRKTKDGQFFLPYYFPDKKHFHLLYSIFPFSMKNAFGQTLSLSLDKLTISSILDPKVNIKLSDQAWRKKLEVYQLHWSAYPSPGKKYFLRTLYNLRMNLFLMPPEIGLPILHSWLIQTPAFIWQAYLYIDIFRKKNIGDFITIEEIERSFTNRINKGQIQTRGFPQISIIRPFQAVMEYVFILEKHGVLDCKGGRSFLVRRNIKIPMTNREKEEMANYFYQQNN
ncbi:competence protein CoiA family protein [Neobacillus sp. PS3-40]|uniref:competence protein CoiA n=1 Tax=Neobacillus sp. PS3-40 TaxID=3070679 RepID=UPI0027DF0245|nr:competence protein CoiA family protein [Neobacillus sp. PS3-40]WML43389.1 competence protein CoiA family protein [Neobacillus sp. PS3-40]